MIIEYQQYLCTYYILATVISSLHEKIPFKSCNDSAVITVTNAFRDDTMKLREAE